MVKTVKKKKKKKPSSWLSDQAFYEISGLLILTCATLVLLSLLSFAHGQEGTNWIGVAGHTVGQSCFRVFGILSYFAVGYLFWIGWRYLFMRPPSNTPQKTFFASCALVSLGMLLSVVEDFLPSSDYHLGGTPLYMIYHDFPVINLRHVLNRIGVTLLFSSTLFMSLLSLFEVSLASFVTAFLSKIRNMISSLKARFENWWQRDTVNPLARYVSVKLEEKNNMLEIEPEKTPLMRPSISRKTKKEEENIAIVPTPNFPSLPKKPLSKRERAIQSQQVINGDFTHYQFPSLDHLTTPKPVDQSQLKQSLKRQAEVLEETLMSFGIEAKVGQINCGPTITSFEVHPAIGVKVQKILSLENDIALNMEAPSIRIIAPIPGKAAIGIEVPNPSPQEVSFKELISAYQKSGMKCRIPLLLGKTVTGEYVMNDLAKMPHVIIAGATGSGKSVCINTIIMSLLFNARPDEIRLLMIDPKKVELTPYSHLPHMIAPVITEPHGAYTAMQWLVKEMESRYELLKLLRVRNIEAFNQRKRNQELEDELSVEIPEKLPYIVGIVDELADLMMVSSSDIETPIARIAQMARAVGIHLILATQRPSREVITGLIKANFPTRIAFKVASRINSQIILDTVGAESLLGNGDMLFLPPGSSNLLRAQGVYIRDEDIHSVIETITTQASTQYLIPSFDNPHAMNDLGIDNDLTSKEADDELFDQALDTVISTGNASTTFLQRKLKVGYARAASLMDALEARGVVSPQEGSRPRRILYSSSNEEE